MRRFIVIGRIFGLKQIIVLVLFALTSCVTDGIDEPTASLEQEIIVCGVLCPPNQIPISFACSTGCTGTCPNAVSCAPVPVYASISADPATVSVPVGSTATSEICWNTSGQNYPVWIKVSANGAPEQLFTKESDPGLACEDAPWIQAGSTYQFHIRSQQTGGIMLASTTVVGVAGPPLPPPPPPPPVCSCSSGYSCHCGDNVCRRNNTICP
jgi:hypothetical protein